MLKSDLAMKARADGKLNNVAFFCKCTDQPNEFVMPKSCTFVALQA